MNVRNMKKTISSLLLIFSMFIYADNKKYQRYNLALTSGFVFKHDKNFKNVYGKGIVDIITADFCYRVLKHFGIGAQCSYWRRKGETTSCKNRTNLHEIPLAFYLKGIIGERFQAYALLGGGIIFVKEKSYLGKAKKHVGIGEAEIGFNYFAFEHIYFTTALRGLFPKKRIICKEKAMLGGLDLRAGIGFAF